jgi:hypothetical protein
MGLSGNVFWSSVRVIFVGLFLNVRVYYFYSGFGYGGFMCFYSFFFVCFFFMVFFVLLFIINFILCEKSSLRLLCPSSIR